MTQIDVNAAFHAERQQQAAAAEAAVAAAREANEARAADFDQRVKDGTMRDLGGGRFQVTDPGSWDDGEVLRLQRNAAGEEMILPEHGLDVSTGEAALYSSVPAWHGLGSVVPGGITSIDEVLKLGRIDFQAEKRPVLYSSAEGLSTKYVPDQFVNVRTDLDSPLGVVGASYTNIQPREAFEFLEDLVAEYGVTWESAGALRGGRSIFVSMKLPNSVQIELPNGNVDDIVPFLVSLNSYDGSSRFRCLVTPWRPLCGNTERFAIRDAAASWGVLHTTNAKRRLTEARKALGLTVKYFETFQREEQALAMADFAIADFERLIDELWEPPADDASKYSKTYAENRRSALLGSFAENAASLGRTAYAAERAVTQYTDWGTPVRSGGLAGGNMAVRATRVLESVEDGRKSKAHKLLMLAVR